MPQLLHFSNPTCAFIPFGIEGVSSQNSQSKLQMLQMFSETWTVNQNVIEENQDEFSQIRLEYMVYKSLKSTRSIS